MYEAKLRCIKEVEESWTSNRFEKDKVYDFKNGEFYYNDKLFYSPYFDYVSLEDINNNFNPKFEEVVEDKITLLLEDRFTVDKNGDCYQIIFYNSWNTLQVKDYDDRVKYTIRWGGEFSTSLEDIKPILDALNVEIVEPVKKYKINTDKEFTEEEKAKLEELGIEFKEV